MKIGGYWETRGAVSQLEVSLARPYLERLIQEGRTGPVKVAGRWWYFMSVETQDPPMTVTVDLEDNPTLVGWVMSDE